MIAALLFIAPVIIFGMLIERWLSRVTSCGWAAVMLSLSLGWVCGLAAASVVAYAIIVVTGGNFEVLSALEWLWPILCGALLFSLRKSALRSGEPHGERLVVVLKAVAGFLLFWCFTVQVLRFLDFSADIPNGSWDAWAIWNARAKNILMLGGRWREAFSAARAWSHPDYPLLLPLVVLRGWVLAGNLSPLVPIGIALGYTLALTGITIGAVRIVAGALPAGMTAAFILIHASWFAVGTSQLADIPLAATVAAAYAIYLLSFQTKSRAGRVLLGFTCAAAAWTKHEGAPFFIVCVAFFAVEGFRYNRAGFRASVGTFLAGAAAPLLAIAHFTITLAPANDLASQFGAGRIGTLFSGDRISEFAHLLAGLVPESFGLEWIVLLIAGGIAIFRGRGSRAALTGIFAAALLYVIYLAVLFTTPYTLAWHMQTAFGRIAVHYQAVLLMGIAVMFVPRAYSAKLSPR